MTRKKLLFLSLFTAFSIYLFAGGIKGSIKDSQGTPLSYATIYIKSEFTGTTTNVEGNYSIKLNPGTYEVVYQYLGYKSVLKKVTVNSNAFTEVHIILNQEILDLELVEVVAGQENPAYTIMRKAIAKSKYHLQQLDSYTARVYIKGSGRIKKAPFFLRKQMKKEGIDSTKAFTAESISEIAYKRPNTYTEKVISLYTHGDDNSVSPNQYLNGSFYEPELSGSISPLSPKAFGYYKFTLEGTFFDQGKMINKIKVTPRSRGDKVFEGFINIVDDEWSIHSLDLTTNTVGITFRIKQIYEPIEDKAWLPVSHTFLITGKILGFGFEYNYLATVSNYQIEMNPELEVIDMVVIDETIQKEKAKELKKQSKKQKKKNQELSDIQAKMAEGKEISRKELRKMMKEYEKQERKESEEPKVESNTTFTVDSLAKNRDTDFWAAIRPVPLTQYEVRGYAYEDSIAIVEKNKAIKDSIKTAKKNKFMPWEIFLPNTVKLGESARLNFGSPLLNLNFNPVEGYHTSYDLHLSKNFANDNKFKLGGKAAYSLARNKVTGIGYFKLDYGSNLEKGRFKIEGGQYVNQVNPNKPIAPIINTFMALLFERNYLKLYQKDYIFISNDKYIRPNLRLLADAEWANRLHPQTQNVKPWIDQDDKWFSSNELPNYQLAQYGYFNRHKAFTIRFGMEYQPWQRYNIKNGNLEIINPSSPRFSVHYRKGIPDVASSISDFDHVEIGYKQQTNIGVRGTLSLQAKLGQFLSKEEVPFVDFKHFMGNRVPFVTSDPVESFRLLDYYNHSTDATYFIGHTHYQFRKFLVSQFLEARFLGIKENLFINYLKTDQSQHYTELGYSIDYIFRFFRLEFVTSYKDFKYDNWGIRIGIGTDLGGIISVSSD